MTIYLGMVRIVKGLGVILIVAVIVVLIKVIKRVLKSEKSKKAGKPRGVEKAGKLEKHTENRNREE